jgi:hypothetical protein
MNILHACYYTTLGKLINNLTVVGIEPLVYIEYIISTVLTAEHSRCDRFDSHCDNTVFQFAWCEGHLMIIITQ